MGALLHRSDPRSRRRRLSEDDQRRRWERERRRESTVVCGVDDSVHARAAARLAAALAERFELPLVLVHAVTAAVPSRRGPAGPDVVPRFEDLRVRELDAARRLEEEMRRELGARQLRVDIRRGPAAPCIAAVADEENAALVVVGCRGAGALSAAVLGSVTDEIVGSAPCPVVVVPPAVAETGAAPLTGESVLCGVQRSDDLACAQVAHELARGLGVRLSLAHVLPRSADAAALTPAGVMPATLAARGVTREGAACAALRRLRDRLPACGATDLRVRRGDPGAQLAELAVAEDAMLVVTGARRWRGPLRAALLGSTSRQLACAGRRPVVLCRDLARSR